MPTFGPSSSVITPKDLPAPIVPPTGFPSTSANASLGSSRTSPLTFTETVLVVWPGWKVTVPFALS